MRAFFTWPTEEDKWRFVDFVILLAFCVYAMQMQLRKIGIELPYVYWVVFIPPATPLAYWLSGKNVTDPDALERYDAYVHEEIMNPIITWIQKWLHVNRYDLLKITIALEFFCYNAAGLILVVSLGVAFSFLLLLSTACIIICLGLYHRSIMRFGGIHNLVAECTSSSYAFEEHGWAKPGAGTLAYCGQRRKIRRVISALVTASLIFEVGHFRNTYPYETLVGVMLQIYLFMMFCACHLADADDLHPRNRNYFGVEEKRTVR
jgi:hypothetical protein